MEFGILVIQKQCAFSRLRIEAFLLITKQKKNYIEITIKAIF